MRKKINDKKKTLKDQKKITKHCGNLQRLLKW
jgi:hypothetical protein